MWVCAHDRKYCRCLWTVEIPTELELQEAVNHFMWVLGAELGSLQELYVLLAAEPSFQLPGWVTNFFLNIENHRNLFLEIIFSLCFFINNCFSS